MCNRTMNMFFALITSHWQLVEVAIENSLLWSLGVSGSSQTTCPWSFCLGQVRPQFNPDGSHSFSLTDRRLSQSITDGFVMDASRNEITFNNFEGIQRERASLFLQLPAKFRGDKVRWGFSHTLWEDKVCQGLDHILWRNRVCWELNNTLRLRV